MWTKWQIRAHCGSQKASMEELNETLNFWSCSPEYSTSQTSNFTRKIKNHKEKIKKNRLKICPIVKPGPGPEWDTWMVLFETLEHTDSLNYTWAAPSSLSEDRSFCLTSSVAGRIPGRKESLPRNSVLQKDACPTIHFPEHSAVSRQITGFGS